MNLVTFLACLEVRPRSACLLASIRFHGSFAVKWEEALGTLISGDMFSDAISTRGS